MKFTFDVTSFIFNQVWPYFLIYIFCSFSNIKSQNWLKFGVFGMLVRPPSLSGGRFCLWVRNRRHSQNLKKCAQEYWGNFWNFKLRWHKEKQFSCYRLLEKVWDVIERIEEVFRTLDLLFGLKPISSLIKHFGFFVSPHHKKWIEAGYLNKI